MTGETGTDAVVGWKKWLIPATLLILLSAAVLMLWRSGFIEDIQNRERLISALREGGFAGPILFVAVQFVQVVVFFIPGEIVQFAAGYVFGPWRGLLYSATGIMLGSVFNFYLARIVGRPVLERFLNPATLKRVDALLNNAKSKSTILLIFLVPGAPKDALCYGAGFSRIGVVEFAVISGLGRAPGLIYSILLGAETFRGDYNSVAVLAVLGGIAIGGYYLYYRSSRRRQSGNRQLTKDT